jgi:hypothetical protein
MTYHIVPSFHSDSRNQVKNILKNLLESFPNDLKIYGFEKNLELSSEKKSIIENIQAMRNSKMVLCFLTKAYIKHDGFKFDLVLADSIKKRVLILVIDDIDDENLNQIRSYNPDISFMNVSKQIKFFENGCFGLFLQFIDDTDRNLKIYKYNGPSTHSCIPVYHFNCRYDPSDNNSTKVLYTRTDNIFVGLKHNYLALCSIFLTD